MVFRAPKSFSWLYNGISGLGKNCSGLCKNHFVVRSVTLGKSLPSKRFFGVQNWFHYKNSNFLGLQSGLIKINKLWNNHLGVSLRSFPAKQASSKGGTFGLSSTGGLGHLLVQLLRSQVDASTVFLYHRDFYRKQTIVVDIVDGLVLISLHPLF